MSVDEILQTIYDSGFIFAPPALAWKTIQNDGGIAKIPQNVYEETNYAISSLGGAAEAAKKAVDYMAFMPLILGGIGIIILAPMILNRKTK